MSDNECECESVDGWNNGEDEEWSDEEPDIETIAEALAEAQFKKFNKYRLRTFSEGSFEDDLYIKESNEESCLEATKNTTESVLEESDEE